MQIYTTQHNTTQHNTTQLQEFHCPLPTGSMAVHCNASTAHCPQVQCSTAHTVQCSTAHKVPIVQRSTHGAVGPMDPV